MDWYLKNGSEVEAMKLYEELLDRLKGLIHRRWLSSELCNASLECLIKHGKTEQVSVLFQTMKNSAPVHINSKSYYIMVIHFLNMGKVSEALMMIRENSGLYQESACRLNNIVQKLCENGQVHEAEKLVMKKLQKEPVETDFVTYQILIEAYMKEAEDNEKKKVDRVDDALELFEKMVFEMKLIPRKGFCEKLFDQLINKWGRINQVADFVERMGAREIDVKPDPTCYEIVMTGLIDAGKLDKVEVLLNQMVNNFTIPTFPDSSKDGENLIFLEKRVKDLAGSGYHDLAAAIARDTFFSRKHTPVSICNIILDSMCTAGRYKDFFSHFRFFFSGPGVVPNSKSYYHLIRAYCGTGCYDDAVVVYNFSPRPSSQEYLCRALVDSDRFDEAGCLVQDNPDYHHPGGKKSTVYYNLISGHLRHGLADADHLGKAILYFDLPCWFSVRSKKTTDRRNGEEESGTRFCNLPDPHRGISGKKNASAAIELFKKMVFEAKLIPHKGFCEKFFDQLIKNGKIEEVSYVIEKMGRDVMPEPVCYKVVITGLIAAGKFDKVKVLLNQMVNNFSAPAFLTDSSTNEDVPQSQTGERWCDLKEIIHCKSTELDSEEEEF